MLNDLEKINERAHIDTYHPNSLEWPEQFGQDECDFISNMVFGEDGHNEKAIVYIVKELAQLAEIEKHLTGVMSIILSEFKSIPENELSQGHEMHHALSCFAAEELQHANTFYRYVRILGKKEFNCPENLYAQRVGLYEGSDSPWVKLAALCCSAYIGESVITVYENRTKALDPEQKHFITRLLVAHGLDEARHIKVDHFIFDHVIPRFNESEKRRMMQILSFTEELNAELSVRFEAYSKELFGIDYTMDNMAHETQRKLTAAFRQHVFGGDEIKKIDVVPESQHAKIVNQFSWQWNVHPVSV